MINHAENNTILYFLENKKYNIHRHLLLLLFVLFFSSSALFEDSGKLNLSVDRFCTMLGLAFVINLIIYSNTYILVPRYLFNGKLLKYVLSVFILLIVSILIVDLFESLFFNPDAEFTETSTTNAILNILTTIFTIGLMIVGIATVMLFKKWMEENQRADALKAVSQQMELIFLKSQINPHFLFNMLNNANILADEDPDMASQILVKLDDLLCYQMNDSTRDKVYLNADIAFLRDFLDLEKTRRDDFDYTISKEGDINNIQVAPLLFIPFVENAVKHNLDSEGLSYVHLSFAVLNGKLKFICENSIPQKEVHRKVGGLGLANIKRRLDLLYGDKYSLELNETDTNYTVHLILSL